MRYGHLASFLVGVCALYAASVFIKLSPQEHELHEVYQFKEQAQIVQVVDDPNMDMVRVIHDQTSFTIDFYKQVWQKKIDENAVLSPLSVSMAMAMAAAGAKGQTLEQMGAVLKLPNGDLMHDFAQQLSSVLLTDASSSEGPALSFANSAWIEQSLDLKQEYRGTVHKQYGAEATPVDFLKNVEEARKMINSWVAKKTQNKIEELLPQGSLDNTSKIILANAIYFKGSWLKPFDPSDTKQGTFYLSNGESIQVPMMTATEKQYITDHGDFKVLRMPYSRGKDPRTFSMYVFLPKERKGLKSMLEKMENAESITNKLLRIQEVPVGKFMLPKFKISKRVEVPELLKKLGMDLAFTMRADFSGIVGSSKDDLFISDVFHEAFVEVNEEGTEASAATAVVVNLKSIRFDEPQDFVADHPFMFLIKEEGTGIVLFIGHVEDPTK